ncbi:zinc-binding metallopeptidase family protein [Rhizobacter fulvus]
MKLFQCGRCGQRVFFDNLRCESCGASLGFVPAEDEMVAFEVTDDGTWRRLGPEGPAQRPCSNYTTESVCNWMVAADDPAPLCVSCRTTRIIPALAKPENRVYWANLELAKRRLFYTLIRLKLPAPSRHLDPVHGLSFQFLEQVDPNDRVLTGHDEGIITLNIAEADDAARERMRTDMHEPYRSLVGHFRHESGHYYWDRLINNTAWIDEYRSLFGDERADYDAALRQHYTSPVPDWNLNYISAYASSHPWEDWAECWAHYLHMVDGLETAAAWGLHLDHAVPGGAALVAQPVPSDGDSVEPSIIEQWLPVSQFCNAMNRALGLHDSYPFVVPAPVVAKLDFIHRVIGAAGRGEMPMNFSSPAAIEPVQDEAVAANHAAPPDDPPAAPAHEPASAAVLRA